MIRRRLSRFLLERRLDRGSLPQAAARHWEATAGLDLRRPAGEASFVVLDSETTGLDPDRDELICLGALRVRQGRIDLGQRFLELVNPGRAFSADSIRVHGILPAACLDRPPLEEVLPRFLEFVGSDVLVGHSLAFDLAFLNARMKKAFGLPILSPALDTLRLCRRLSLHRSPYLARGRLEDECGLDRLARRYRLEASLRHTALGDALLTAQIFLIMLGQFRRLGLDRLDRLLRIGGV